MHSKTPCKEEIMVLINGNTDTICEVTDKGEEKLWIMEILRPDGTIFATKTVTYREWVMERECYNECKIRPLGRDDLREMVLHA